jgi:SAM-dependent methyltransferase
MPAPATTQRLSPQEGYRLWSRVYDAEPNPMLSLEERYLYPLLPPLAGRDIVDLGCGTGRWLVRLAAHSSRSMVGVDSSPEMLEHAERKLGGSATLLAGDAEHVPLPESSADIVLASFVLSYLSGLDHFAEEIRRIARPDAHVFLTDVHPVTELVLGWARGFRAEDAHITMATRCWPLDQILLSFRQAGFRVAALLEPHFGQPELAIFLRAGKARSFAEAASRPAIYILQLRPESAASRKRVSAAPRDVAKILRGARVALGPRESVSANLRVDDGRIGFLGSSGAPARSSSAKQEPSLDLNGFLLLPGIVNSHDHLEFALYPRLGKGGYRNFTEWADDIHRPDSPPIREHRAVPRDVRLWWGGIRNLLCGATTVCHHNPYATEVFDGGFPVRVVREFSWTHSLCMDPDAGQKRRVAPADQPFILHLAEGVDLQSAQEIFDLDRAGALDSRTVIVHGLALGPHGKELLKSRNAALIWCPTSNVFLFGKTHDRDAIRHFPHVALGSDSPLTAQGDLLDELRFAREHTGISAEELYKQVTSSAARILCLKKGEGSIRADAVADLVAVRDTGCSPAASLAALSFRDVELVLIGGRVHLASPAVLERLPKPLRAGLCALDVEGETRWLRANVEWLLREAKSALGPDIRLGGKRVGHAVTA